MKKKDFQVAMQTKNKEPITLALQNHWSSQTDIKEIVQKCIAENTERKEKLINQNDRNTKPFWNLVQKMKRKNLKDLFAIKDEKGSKRLMNNK